MARRQLTGITLARLSALLTLAVAGIAHAAVPVLPPDFNATYTFERAGFTIAASTVTLVRNGDEAVYSSIAKPAGVLTLIRNDEITERSTLRIVDGRLSLKEYLYTHTGTKKPRDVRIAVKDGVVRGQWNGQPIEAPAPGGTLDRFSLQLGLMRDLARGGEAFAYTTVENRKVKTFRFVATGRETLKLPTGSVEAIRIERLPDEPGDAQMTSWFAPSLHYLPVKMERVEEGGGRTTLVLTGIEWK